jgi:hypothetical protein
MYYIEEDPIAGEFFVIDDEGQELQRFSGADALNQALKWAEQQGLQIHSTLGPDELADFHRLFFRRGLRRLRLFRMQQPTTSDDPPNVKRIVVPEYYEDDPWGSHEEQEESVELAPDDDDE